MSHDLEHGLGRLRELSERARQADPAWRDLALQAIEELHGGIEELRAAEEELRLQNHDLERARAEVERGRRHYQDLFDLAFDGYLLTDGRGVVEAANGAACRLLSVAPPGLHGKPLAVYVPERERASFYAALERGGDPLEWEGRLAPRGAPPLPVSLVAAPRRASSGALTGFLWRVRDLTRERHAAEQMRRADRVKGAMLASVSHELRTPLTAIASAAELLRHDGPAVERRDLAELIWVEARRLDRMVANLLDLSRLEGDGLRPRLQPYPADALVGSAVAAAEAVLEAPPFVVRVGDEMILARADPVLCERILVNLLANAVEHGAPPVTIAVARAPERVEIAVSDAGAGVPDDFRASVFDPFVGGGARGRAGLGLAIARGLAHAQGGTVRLAEGPGGARFALSLPLEPAGAVG